MMMMVVEVKLSFEGSRYYLRTADQLYYVTFQTDNFTTASSL